MKNHHRCLACQLQMRHAYRPANTARTNTNKLCHVNPCISPKTVLIPSRAVMTNQNAP
jgi:hypothetical protein